MKVLTVSDNVLAQLEDSKNLCRAYADVDAVISCGDMPAPYIEYIASTLNVPLFFVRGNHDTQYSEGNPGGDNLHGRVVRFNGFVMAGLEGCIQYNREPVQYTDGQMYWMVLALWPKVLWQRARGRGLDIMVTHSPPRDIHDLPDRAHRGFKSFRLMLRLFKPRYLIHGHVDTHDSRRPTRTDFNGTLILNINPVKLITFEPKQGST